MNMRISAGELTERSLQIIRDLKHLEGPMLPILHAIQAEFGYVPEEVKPVIASELNLSRAEVHGVVTFYHEFRDHPAGRHVLKLCRAEACQSMGSDRIADHARQLLGIDFHQTTLDGAVTLEPVYCLGLCACAPAAMLDGEVLGRVDEHCLSEIVAGLSR
ncbi:formate dehydrogenase subunit gamma [Neorhizobium galegae]|uniref:NADH dehydrogenase (Ubiquinone) 24 kDa subunit n=2 Tax=Neorhizobium galegae TaxID=399 RepID=A0A068SVL9_NEOGA|nr:formate dehydrogenase subunit gamma [Neorhizobium galegae]KAB1088418.1 formate dehydrogenase subunit gamma [Neorhizobium galegae]MCQ1853588.1 formate dehydrogenase subunit gamma [Neorhizobium galegae]CDN49806.1 NADH dehydrogenase (Ubiquinone) 24 kDa subunit [Neorhizobium galegae bv. orientalis str. HAMBI 540]